MSPLTEFREATQDEADLLDGRRRKGTQQRKVREAPQRDLSDQVAEKLLRGETVTLVYIDNKWGWPIGEKWATGSGYREAENTANTFRLYLGQKNLPISATLEWDEPNHKTKLIICARDSDSN